jgi:hypothetical protein
MSRKIYILFLLALLLSLVTVGCGAAPTPTKPAPTQPPQVITVVITATPLPATATPIPTIALTATVPISTPVAVKPTATPGTPKPPATKSPTVAATATASPLPLKFAAPKLVSPAFNDLVKDEFHFPSDALIFKWEITEGLNGDECYLVAVRFDPGQGDTFLTGCANKDRKPTGLMEFTLHQPRREGPNYSALLPDRKSVV